MEGVFKLKLEARNIYVSFPKEQQKKWFGKEKQQIINGVSLEILSGESVALVGESGSGKSTLGRVISGILPPDKGEVLINGMDLYAKNEKHLMHQKSIVFQDYKSSVNPRFKVRNILWESLRVRKDLDKDNLKETVASYLEQVGLDESLVNRYPHELSGGQLQRVCIARALAVNPEFIILDEAVSSLDSSTQTQVMDLLIDLQKKYKFSYLFITHDLTAVTYMCNRVLFFNEGQIIESIDNINKLPYVKHPYAKKLLDSVITVSYNKI